MRWKNRPYVGWLDLRVIGGLALGLHSLGALLQWTIAQDSNTIIAICITVSIIIIIIFFLILKLLFIIIINYYYYIISNVRIMLKRRKLQYHRTATMYKKMSICQSDINDFWYISSRSG